MRNEGGNIRGKTVWERGQKERRARDIRDGKMGGIGEEENQSEWTWREEEEEERRMKEKEAGERERSTAVQKELTESTGALVYHAEPLSGSLSSPDSLPYSTVAPRHGAQSASLSLSLPPLVHSLHPC